MMSDSPPSAVVVLVDGFQSVKDNDNPARSAGNDGTLRWYCPPDGWNETLIEGKREGRGGSWSIDSDGRQLTMKPPAYKDFWRKTYYDPVFVKDDGSALLATVPTDRAIMAETSFSIGDTTRQFDQAGIYVRIDSEHWLKTGIEIVDGKPRLSCVCTNGMCVVCLLQLR